MKIIQRDKPIEVIAVCDDKFKNVTISLRVHQKLQDNENTKLALLSNLINDRNIYYPTKKEIRNLKDNLYGASFRTSLFGYGPLHTLELRLTMISENTINEDIQIKQVNALKTFLYYPLINEETLREAKLNLRNKLYRQSENPMNASIKRAFEIIGENTDLRISTQGRLEEIDAISLNDMIEFHKNLIKDAPVILYAVGDIKHELIDEITSVFSQHNNLSTKAQYNTDYYLQRENIVEYSNVNQATLVMTLKTEITIEDPLYYPLRLASIILGQLPTSLLFQEVRERASLCYSISSSIIAFNSLMLITTSLDEKNVSKAIDLINVQLDRLKRGDYPDSLIEGAKELMNSNFNTIEDDEFSILSFISDSRMLSNPMDPNHLKNIYSSINKELITKAVEKLEPILIYSLQGEENESY